MNKLTREEYDNLKSYSTIENCPFCNDIDNSHKILFRNNNWIIIYALYPYFDIEKEHIIVVPVRHVEFSYELSKEEFSDYKNVELFLKDYFNWKDYFSFIRQSKSNKSVEHLHYHYLPWRPSSRLIDGEKYIKIK